ncbi:hypothetical protein H5410_032021 [Solanum commersonii]|uniref:Uncharacterized protein n=1 Tax=Solanum commersonii TaxID=4109 RepID=A0A9J5YIT3_SOLCO|nr:hypothetical protein H5410_032021 [Solanum commersonii]
MKEGLQYYISKKLLPAFMKTDSVILKNVLDGIWEILWSITSEVRSETQKSRESTITFSSYKELLTKAKQIQHMDKQQIPSMRIKRVQNTQYNKHLSPAADHSPLFSDAITVEQ